MRRSLIRFCGDLRYFEPLCLGAFLSDFEVALHRVLPGFVRMRLARFARSNGLDLGYSGIELRVIGHQNGGVEVGRCLGHLALRSDVDVEIRYSARKIECRSPE